AARALLGDVMAARGSRRAGRAGLSGEAGAAADERGRGGVVGLRHLLRIVAEHRRWVTAGIALTLAGLALGMAQPLLVQRIIESATRGPIEWGAIAVLISLALGQAVVGVMSRYVLAKTSESVVLRTR